MRRLQRAAGLACRLVVLIAAFTGLSGSRAHGQGPGWAEKMFQQGVAHDFGVIPKGSLLLHRFPVTNIYAVRMEITQIQPGCGCVTAVASKRFLEPRETGTIDVSMDAKRFDGPKSVGIRVTVGPEFVSSAELRVTANARGDLVFNPGRIVFGAQASGAEANQTVVMEYAGAFPLEVREVVTNQVPVNATVRQLYREPGRVGYEVSATLKTDGPPGAFKDSIFLKTNDPNQPMVPLLVEGAIESGISIIPQKLALGSVSTQDMLTRRVVVRGQKPFQILSVEGTGQGVELSGELSPTPSMTQTISLKVQLKTPGEFRRELKIRTTLQDAPLSLPVDGSATP
ncbi:MAG: DUF1573 domain-containing protein [Gemmataceae bacterium]